MTNKHYRKQWLSLLCSSILLGCFHTTTKFESEWQGTFDCRVANNIFPTSETTFNQIRSKVAEDQSLANCTMVIARAGGKEFRFLKRTGSNEVEFLMFGPAGQSEGLRLNLASDLAEQIRNRFSRYPAEQEAHTETGRQRIARWYTLSRLGQCQLVEMWIRDGRPVRELYSASAEQCKPSQAFLDWITYLKEKGHLVPE